MTYCQTPTTERTLAQRIAVMHAKADYQERRKAHIARLRAEGLLGDDRTFDQKSCRSR